MVFDLHTIFLIAHLFGVAIGAGGAYASDLMFLSSIRDQKISRTEIRFLKLGSMMVWGGLLLLVLSGIGLFMQDIPKYIESTKFLVKITIVLLLIINGIFFHLTHIPRIVRHAGEHFPSSDEFMRKRPILLTSGAISIVSWSFAIILGALQSVPYSYWQMLGIYFGCIILAIITALLVETFVISEKK